MRNYIILNNQRSDEINGLIIQELAPISKPLQRTQVETIDGRDGDIVTPLGYAAYDKKITIGLYGDFDINEIIAYFATQGTAIFSNEPDKYYNYQILDQIDYERLVRFRVATVTMHVQPFKYSATEGTITVDSSDTVSGEGSNIALANTAEAPFNTLRHKGNATQQTYSGKNLFNKAATVINSSNCTYTYENGVFTITNTNTNNPQITLAVSLPVGSYVLNSASYLSRTTQLRGANVAVANLGNSYQNAAFTITSAADSIRFNWLSTTDTITLNLNTLQIEAGSSTATAYEPYVGGIPSPNPDYPQDIQVVTGDSTVKITGKNLIDVDNAAWASSNATLTENNGVFEMGAQSGKIARLALPIPKLVSGITYVISFEARATSVAGSGSNTYVRLRELSNSGTWLSDSVGITVSDSFSKKTITYTPTTITEPYLWFYLSPSTSNTNNVDIFVKNIQVELGSQASDYEPYKEQSYVIPFGDTYLAGIGDYADEPVKVDGTWYIRRAIGKVDLGTLTWTGTPLHSTTSMTDIKYTSTNTELGAILAEKYTPHIGSGMSSATGCIAVDVNAVRVNDTNTPSGLAYYALATPVDEEITDQDLIDALDELYGQAHSYKGHTHIAATAEDGNAPAILSVEVGEDNESTVTNSGNTTSRPIITIYGQGDIGVYINDVQVLDITLGNEQYITLDSTEMDAYKDSPANLKNRLVTGDYSKLALNAGANKIRFTGNVTKYEISKYSRWL